MCTCTHTPHTVPDHQARPSLTNAWSSAHSSLREVHRDTISLLNHLPRLFMEQAQATGPCLPMNLRMETSLFFPSRNLQTEGGAWAPFPPTCCCCYPRFPISLILRKGSEQTGVCGRVLPHFPPSPTLGHFVVWVTGRRAALMSEERGLRETRGGRSQPRGRSDSAQVGF